MLIHGGNIVVSKIADSGYEAFAAAKSCEVEVDCEELEVSSPATGKWRDYTDGRLGWRVTVSGLVTNTISDKLLMAGKKVYVKIANATDADDYLTGNALVKSPKLTANKGSISQYSVVLVGCGELAPAEDVAAEGGI